MGLQHLDVEVDGYSPTRNHTVRIYNGPVLVAYTAVREGWETCLREQLKGV